MKKVLISILALLLVLGLVGCSSTPIAKATNTTEPTETTPVEEMNIAEPIQIEPPVETESQTPDKGSLDDYPIIGMWQSETDDVYLRIIENGALTFEAVLTNSSTTTVNGVTTSSISKSISAQPATWEIQSDNFMLNKLAPFQMTFDGTNYKLVGENATYVRVGEVDYEIALDDSEGNQDDAMEATPYAVGEPISADGIEMIFSEVGFSDDIRVIGSRPSGLTITSGPSPEADKQFFYLRGKLKNTAKKEVRPAIGGKTTLDGYDYKINVDIINEDGTPCSTVEPLDSVIILIYAHIPTELTRNFTEGEMIFGFNDSFEDVDIANADYLYSVKAAKE